MPTRAKDMAYVNHQQLTVKTEVEGAERGGETEEAISCTANRVTMRLFKKRLLVS
jgi:hypothetical protein